MELSNNKTRIVANLPHLQFVNNSQDVAAIKEHIGKDADDYDSFFIAIKDGDYTEVWGMVGIVPRLSKLVSRLIPNGDK